MSSRTPHSDVQKELEELSPLLARMREQNGKDSTAPIDMDMLQDIGKTALSEVPLAVSDAHAPSPLRVVYSKRKWLGLAAASIAMLCAALISYNLFTSVGGANTEFTGVNSALTAELIASYEEQTADPMAFLLAEESIVFEEEELFFSPAEDVLLDWADDGSVDEELSEEAMIDALW